MSDNAYKAAPLSRKNIRDLVKWIRLHCGLQNNIYLDVPRFLEHILPQLVDGVEIEYVESSEMPDKEAETYPGLNLIRIREDVYEKAVKGDGRSRFTILHEVGHLLLHDTASVALCRTSSGYVKTYEKPEWQADVFAGEMLMYEPLIRDMSVEEIAEKCGASYAAASCQYDKTREQAML